jgi:bifunctional N-acetylglucosamine-1-phosphate-uridyltransferase/glucosamine-1-phosphate-acetyltransferase GlmU-like protein
VSRSRPAAVIVLAAGEGTRMRSGRPKVLHEIAGRSLLGHAVAAARGLDPSELVVVVRHERDAVVEHLQQIAPDVVVAEQDEVKGTGRATACGLAALSDRDGTVVITYGDVPVAATITSLERQGYDGLYVLEQDVAITDGEPPLGEGPVRNVAKNVAFLRSLDASLGATVRPGEHAGVAGSSPTTDRENPTSTT